MGCIEIHEYAHVVFRGCRWNMNWKLGVRINLLVIRSGDKTAQATMLLGAVWGGTVATNNMETAF